MDKMELSKRVGQLVSEAASKEGRLEMTQVLDHFRDVQMTPEEMEEVYLKLERKGVHIQAPEEPEEELPEGDKRKRRTTTDMARSGFWKVYPQPIQSVNT